MLRVPILILLAVLPAAACIWDRDTLREEAKGKLDTVQAITGWFDRYPPRYYEIRLERVTKELEAKPDALDLYDDAGVACDRLGRHDEAIEWMAKKKAVLDALPPDSTAEQRYRYLSNLGTFHLLRWASKPEEVRSADLTDLKTSEGLVARALELNPDAHFGREKFQLMLIRWLLDPTGGPGGRDPNFLGLDENRMFRSLSSGNVDFTLDEARKGITGLIQLGAAWESVDVFQTLQMCLQGEKLEVLAHLAHLRQKELAAGGKRSLHPVEKVGDGVSPYSPESFMGIDTVNAYFQKARAAATDRQAAWTAYQEALFDRGMHPDTHADFWKDWKEPKFPPLPGPSLTDQARQNPGGALLGMLAILVVGGLGAYWAIKRFSSSRKPVAF